MRHLTRDSCSAERERIKCHKHKPAASAALLVYILPLSARQRHRNVLRVPRALTQRSPVPAHRLLASAVPRVPTRTAQARQVVPVAPRANISHLLVRRVYQAAQNVFQVSIKQRLPHLLV